MNRKMVSGLVLTTLLVGMLTFNILPINTYSISGDIMVPDDYSTIQEAVNAASQGDTIFVGSRTYYENVVVNKTVSLVGEDKDTTIIDGNGTGNVFTIVQNNINISGFTVQNSGRNISNSGIFLNRTNHCTIAGNHITNNLNGIWLNTSSQNFMEKNHITNNSGGIILYQSSNNKIHRNNITENDNAILVVESGNVTISENLVALHEDFGIVLVWGGGNTITGNIVRHTANWSLYFYSSSFNNIFRNNIENNGVGVTAESSYYNQFYHNNFINNTQQVDDPGIHSFWDYGYPSGGNYWSDYAGTDDFWGMTQDLKGYDMIGDTSYVIGEENIDNYPLMTPWRECKPPITEFPDLNGDGTVNIVDVSTVALYFGEEFQDP